MGERKLIGKRKAEEADQPELFLARQPIFDNNGRVYGYELLYRPRVQPTSEVKHQDAATAQVILNAFVELGIERLVGAGYAFVNMGAGFINTPMLFPFSHQRLVIEVLEDVAVDTKLLDNLKRLSKQGYRLALDDFVLSKEKADLIEVADFIKLDVRQLSFEQLEQTVGQLKDHKAQLIAEKVETRQEYRQLKDLGFSMFQGHFFAEPEIIHQRVLKPDQMRVLELLAKLENPEANAKEVEDLIRTDVALSYQILRWVNSAYYGLSFKIESVNHAIVYLGLTTIRNWVRLLVLARLTTEPLQEELLLTAVVRGRMCELLAKDNALSTESAFTVGLFSVLESLIQRPMSEIVEQLPLPAEVNLALTRGEGPYGELLATAEYYETADWKALDELEVDAAYLTSVYLQAIDWTQMHHPGPVEKPAASR